MKLGEYIFVICLEGDEKLTTQLRSSRVVIIGTGAVGATTAYTLLLRERVSELVLIDANKDRALGEALDMNHGLPLPAASSCGRAITAIAKTLTSSSSRPEPLKRLARRGLTCLSAMREFSTALSRIS